ncbi:hypothetical protein RQP46_010828 [Phenoliferia psychrophenolica]
MAHRTTTSASPPIHNTRSSARSRGGPIPSPADAAAAIPAPIFKNTVKDLHKQYIAFCTSAPLPTDIPGPTPLPGRFSLTTFESWVTGDSPWNREVDFDVDAGIVRVWGRRGGDEIAHRIAKRLDWRVGDELLITNTSGSSPLRLVVDASSASPLFVENHSLCDGGFVVLTCTASTTACPTLLQFAEFIRQVDSGAGDRPALTFGVFVDHRVRDAEDLPIVLILFPSHTPSSSSSPNKNLDIFSVGANIAIDPTLLPPSSTLLTDSLDVPVGAFFRNLKTDIAGSYPNLDHEGAEAWVERIASHRWVEERRRFHEEVEEGAEFERRNPFMG